MNDTSIAILIVLLFAANVILVNKDAAFEIRNPLSSTDPMTSSDKFERLDKVTPNMTVGEQDQSYRRRSLTVQMTLLP